MQDQNSGFLTSEGHFHSFFDCAFSVLVRLLPQCPTKARESVFRLWWGEEYRLNDLFEVPCKTKMLGSLFPVFPVFPRLGAVLSLYPVGALPLSC